MKLVVALVLLTLNSVGAHAQRSVDELLNLAIERLNSGHQKQGERYLQAVLDRDPRHPDALWQLTWRSLRGLGRKAPEQRAERLASVGPAVLEIARIAEKRGDPGFGHYVMARYARFYNAFDRAVSEIDHALNLTPNSTRYLMAKGLLLTWKGDWEESDATIKAGISVIEQARLQSRKYPSIHWTEPEFHVARAQALGDLSRPPWSQIIEAYELAVETGNYAGNTLARRSISLSWAYRNAGRCEDAEKTAMKALAIVESKSARRELTKALFCLEMQSLGLLPKEASKEDVVQ